jgi:hypothetical protein
MAMTPSREALLVFSVATVIGHVIGISPWHGEDLHAMHAAFEHATFSQLVACWLSRAPILHIIITPLVSLALVFGLFTIAARRLPYLDSWTDTISIIVLAAFVWVATPSADVVWSHRADATMIYGATVALWVAAPYRCNWRPRAIYVPIIFVAGFCAASSARQIALPLLAGVVYAMLHGNRARWMWIGLAGIVLGTIAGFIEEPRLDVSAFVASSGKLAVLTTSLQSGAHLFALLLLVGLAAFVMKASAPAFKPANAVETIRWIWAWCALALLAVFDPSRAHSTLLPSAVILCVAAFPYLAWMAAGAGSRRLLGVVAIAIHFVAWTDLLAR